MPIRRIRLLTAFAAALLSGCAAAPVPPPDVTCRPEPSVCDGITCRRRDLCDGLLPDFHPTADVGCDLTAIIDGAYAYACHWPDSGLR
jgi:hypothetical protein